MATQEEKQAYVDEMAEKRGYVLDYHKVMAEHDYEVLQAANGLVDAACLKERTLVQEVFDAWREVTGAEGIESTVKAHQGGSGSD